LKEKNKKTVANNAYSLWQMNGCQQGFRSVVNFGFGGQESALKPPQAICKPLKSVARCARKGFQRLHLHLQIKINNYGNI